MSQRDPGMIDIIQQTQQQRRRAMQSLDIDDEVATMVEPKSDTSSATKATMDTGSQNLCHSTQFLSLNDTAATDTPPKAHDMLQLCTNPEKLAIAQTNAANSPLLRLPAELRNKIYNFVLDSQSDLHTRDAPRRKRARQSRGEESGNELALLRVCRQLYEETSLLPFSLTPFTFHNLPVFSKYLAQTLLPSQIAAITVLRCPCDEIYFPRLGVYTVFLGLLAGSLTGLRDLTLMEVRVVGGDEDKKKMGELITGYLERKCGLEVRVELRSERLEGRNRALYGGMYAAESSRSMRIE